ncbi:MAG: TIGR01777 family oxidoreductase [Acidobacteriota bacterium]
MRVVVPGGSGQVGTLLARALHGEGHEVTVLSRRPAATPWSTRTWDGKTRGDWCAAIDGCDAVINLAGFSVDCRYNRRNRERILNSRLDSTRVVGEAIVDSAAPPPVWLQMSTATIYAHRFDASNDEESGEIGGGEPGAPRSWDFSIEVAQRWEQAALAAPTPETRKVLLRTAMVMSPDAGGIFDVLLGLTRRGLGGRSGSGRQFVSWIHGEDFVDAVRWLIDHREVRGVVNLAAPEPLPNGEFMAALRHAWGARWGLPATAWMLEIGALILRTETELVLKSRRVVPGRLLAEGFEFRYPNWPEAARELCREWRRRRAQEA